MAADTPETIARDAVHDISSCLMDVPRAAHGRLESIVLAALSRLSATPCAGCQEKEQKLAAMAAALRLEHKWRVAAEQRATRAEAELDEVAAYLEGVNEQAIAETDRARVAEADRDRLAAQVQALEQQIHDVRLVAGNAFPNPCASKVLDIVDPPPPPTSSETP